MVPEQGWHIVMLSNIIVWKIYKSSHLKHSTESSKALVVCAVSVILFCDQPCEFLKTLCFFQQVHYQDVAMYLNSPSRCVLI